MNRRAYLRAVTAVGAIGISAGCLGDGDDQEATGSPATLTYPLFPPTVYDLSSERVSDPDGTPTPFADLSSEARLELATVVHRGVIRSGNPQALRDEEVGYVQYRDAVWGASGGVGDAFTQPEHGPEGDPDWEDPAPVRTSVDDGELTVTLSNALETDLPVHFPAPPAFGVLVAVGESAAVLDHDGYADSDHVRTDGIVRAQPGRPSEYDETRQLSPGESLSETYAVPDDLTGEATVRTSIWIGDDSFDMLGNRRQLLVATFTHEF